MGEVRVGFPFGHLDPRCCASRPTALRRFPFRAREPTASVSVVVSMRRRNMDTATALRPELKATNERGMYTVASARPRVVTGYTSPYPIVVP